MTKNEFTRVLKSKINHLPKSERRKILQYYYEMISERMEDGMTEAEAIDAAVKQVLAEGYRTGDIMSEGMKQVGCKEMGTLVAQRI